MATPSRPKRRVAHRNLEYNGGLLHEEELALRRALQASMATSKKPSDLDQNRKETQKSQAKFGISRQKSSTQTEIKSTMKVKKKRDVSKESGVSSHKKRKTIESSSSNESRSHSPCLASYSDNSEEHNHYNSRKVNSCGIQTSKKLHKDRLGGKKLDKKINGSQKETLLRKSFKVRRKILKRKHYEVNKNFSANESESESTGSSSTYNMSQSATRMTQPSLESQDMDNVGEQAVKSKTEDFLTFLCLRGGNLSIPKQFEVFNSPCTVASSQSDDDFLSTPSSPSPSESPLSPSIDYQCETPSVDSTSLDGYEEMHAIRMYAGITNISDAKDKVESSGVDFVEPDSEEEPLKFCNHITPPLSFEVSPRPSSAINGIRTSLSPCAAPSMAVSSSAFAMMHTDANGINNAHSSLPSPSADDRQLCSSPPPLLYIPAAAQLITHLHGPPTLEKVTSAKNSSVDDQAFPDSPPVLTRHLPTDPSSASTADGHKAPAGHIVVPSFINALESTASEGNAGSRNVCPTLHNMSSQQMVHPIIRNHSLPSNDISRDIPVIDLCQNDSPLGDSRKVTTYVDSSSCPLHSRRSREDLSTNRKSQFKSLSLAKPAAQRPATIQSVDCPLHSPTLVTPREIPVIDLCDSSFDIPAKSTQQDYDSNIRAMPKLQFKAALNCNNNLESRTLPFLPNISEQQEGICESNNGVHCSSSYKNSHTADNTDTLNSNHHINNPFSPGTSPPLGDSPMRKLRSCTRSGNLVVHQTKGNNRDTFGVSPEGASISPPWSHLQTSYPSPVTSPKPYSFSLTTARPTSDVTSSSGYPSNYYLSHNTTQTRDDHEMASPANSRDIGRKDSISHFRDSASLRVSETYHLPKTLRGNLPCQEGAKSHTSLSMGFQSGLPNGSERDQSELRSLDLKDRKSDDTEEQKSKGKSPVHDKKHDSKKNTTPEKKVTRKTEMNNSHHSKNSTNDSPRTKKKANISTADAKPVSKPSDSPILRPTEEEFKDPVAYLKSVQSSLQKFGICIVEPPDTWQPESQLPENLRFNTHCQLVHRLKERWGPAEIKLACIEKHLKQQNSFALSQMPQIGGLDADLPEISRVMAAYGGLQKVIDSKKWTKVADTLRIPKAAQDRIGKLEDIYCKYLLSYDLLPEEEKQKLEEQVKKDISVEINAGDLKNETEKDTQCIRKGRYHSTVSFQRVARNMQEHFFKSANPSAADVEREYWKIVQARDRYVSVHHATVGTEEHGSCFPVVKNNLYAKSGWNLNVLPQLKGSLLKHVGNIEGLTVPWLNVNMVFSTNRWSVHPLHMYTLSYLHTSTDKIWYGLPAGNITTFPKSPQGDAASGADDRDAMVSPSKLLRETGLTVTRLVQKPGQFVVASPKAYHCSISCGYSLSESVAFAFPDWLLRVPSISKNVFAKWPSFPYDRMVVAMADEVGDESEEVLQCIHKELSSIREREVTLRTDLIELGITNEEKPKQATKGSKCKSSGLQVDGRDLYCKKCEQLCSLSAVVSKEEPETLCLKHAVELLRRGGSSCEQHILTCYSLSQIDDILSKVKEKLRQLDTR